jgi:hypothetical protein
MTDEHLEPVEIPDVIKEKISSLGILPKLVSMHAHQPLINDNLNALKSEVTAKIEDVQAKLTSGNLNDADLQKLNTVLIRLLGALASGHISHSALALALAEASIAINVADSKTGTNETLHQKMEQLWYQIEKKNNDIDDDFEKMRKANIVFDENLWNKHMQLLDYLQAHPHDIEKQKELNAVDDVLLQQAAPQLEKCPDAKPYFQDATEKSKERHQTVDHDLAALKKQTIAIADADWDTPYSQEKPKAGNGNFFQEATMNDVEPPSVGQKPQIKTGTSVSKSD